MSGPKPKQDLVRLARQAGIYLVVPMVLVGGPCIGFIIGRALDQRLSSDPWGVAIAVLTGLIVSIIQTIRLFRYAQREFSDESS